MELTNPIHYVLPINVVQKYNIELLWTWQEGFLLLKTVLILANIKNQDFLSSC